MKQTLRLGRVRGIPIGVNWSVLGIAALIGWTLATSLLPELVPGSSAAAYWAAGLVAAAAFFSSLLAHELAHALVGRHYGIGIDSITLWLLGGVSRFESEPPSAGAELRISLAGPLTSLGLGVGFGVVATAAEGLQLPDLVVGTLVWLSLVNFMLGLFNLLPAYPLDGGRVLRALAWFRSGDRLAATRTAARVGRVMAWLLIGLGLLTALSGAWVSGLWLVLIGWYVDNAGRLEAAAVAEQSALSTVPVGRLMSPVPVTVPGSLSLDELARRYVLRNPDAAFPVVTETGQALGLVGLEQVRRVPPQLRAGLTVAQIAEPLAEVPVVEPDDTGADTLARMTSRGSRRALVVDGHGRLVGSVSRSDLVRAVQVAVPPGPPPPPPR